MSTTQLAIVCVAALSAIVVVSLVRLRMRRDELDAERVRAERAAVERADRRSEELAAQALAGGPAGPDEGATLVVHVDGRDVRGRRVLAGDPAADDWVVLDDAAILSGVTAQELGGRQWFARGPGMWVQEVA